MPGKSEQPISAYIQQQVEAISVHLPRAIARADVTATHQARVATRRMKAAIEMLKGAVESADMDELSERCGRVRRALGPLRDADVMLEQIESQHNPSKSKASSTALTAMVEELKSRRAKAKSRVKDKLDVADVEMIRGPAHRVCVAVDGLGDVGRLLLRDAVHRHYEAFKLNADRVANQCKSDGATSKSSVDLHQLRIQGKALRYTLEIGELSVAPSAGKGRPAVSDRLKPLQDRLGRWHDRVVLGQVAIEWMSESQIVLHDDARAEAMLKYAAGCVRAGRAEIARFCDAWKTSRVAIARGIRNTYPLVKRVTARQTMENGSRSDAASEN